MPSGFPNSIDSFTNPLASSPLNSPSHAGQHQDLNDAVNKIETYMGLVFVKSQTIGTAVSSVAVTSAFSSLYDNYLITVSGGFGSIIRTDLQLTLGASTTNHFSQLIYGNYAGSALAANSNNVASFNWVGSSTTDSISASITLTNPFLAKYTRFSAPWWADVDAGICTGIHTLATSYTSFTIFPRTGTITGGTIRVYGYRN